MEKPDIGTTREEFLRDVFFLNYANEPGRRWDTLWDISRVARMEEEFFHWVAGEWTVVSVGAYAVTFSTAQGDGAAIFTNAAADDDYVEILKPGVFAFVLLKPLYAEGRFKLSDGLQSDAWFGLVDGRGTPFSGGVLDGIYFWKPDGTRRLYFRTVVGGVATDIDTGYDVEDWTWGIIGFHWDGNNLVSWFVFDDLQVLLATGTITVAAQIPVGTYLHPGHGHRNGEAVAKALYVDYHKFAKVR